MDSFKTIAVIPARGGSKRIPRKNVRNFRGKPLISYSIAALLESQLFDEVCVSTDDEEIAEIAISLGASVPFLRSPELSGDRVLTVPVISDFVKKMELAEDSVVCCTYATAPLIEVADLINGYKQLFIEPTPDYVCAVAKYGYPIQRALRKVNGILEMAEMENLEKFSQELDERYHDAGQFYFAKAQTWIEMKPMLVNTRGIELPSWKVQDIDNLEDWERAEILFDIMKIKSQTSDHAN